MAHDRAGNGARTPADPSAPGFAPAGGPESLRGDRLARVVSARGPRVRDLSIADHVRGLAKSLRAADTGLAAAVGAWERVVPPALCGSCTIESISRGVLRVRVPDAGVRFELDRFLRSGGESSVIGACRTPIRSVKLLP